MVQTRDISFASSGATLAGSLWLPTERPDVGVVMVGGSGPTDRHNDVLFPPIRQHLLARGIAVLSYDKRGVGGSSGSWIEATIDELAADAAAAHEVLRPEVASAGLLGHSEGGWVVLRAAAACQELAFVITNSTPGVTPAVQDRHSVQAALQATGASGELETSVLSLYDALVVELRRGATWEQVQPMLTAEPELVPYFGGLDEAAWQSARHKLDHDPSGDIASLRCPSLAVFGSADLLVPLEQSAAVFSAAAGGRPLDGPPVTLQVFPGADHRLGVGDRFAAGYLDALAGWIEGVTAAA